MKKLYFVFTLCFFFCFTLSTKAQHNFIQERFFFGVGWSAFDFIRSPMVTANEYHSPLQRASIALISVSAHPRLNLVEFGKHASVSVNAAPALGLFSSYPAFSAPLTLNFNAGNIATVHVEKAAGFTIGAGAEYNVIFPSWLFPDEYEAFVGKRLWVQPVINMGYRYWSRHNKAKEVNLKIGYGRSGLHEQKDQTSKEMYEPSTSGVSVRLSFIKYLNY